MCNDNCPRRKNGSFAVVILGVRANPTTTVSVTISQTQNFENQLQKRAFDEKPGLAVAPGENSTMIIASQSATLWDHREYNIKRIVMLCR